MTDESEPSRAIKAEMTKEERRLKRQPKNKSKKEGKKVGSTGTKTDDPQKLVKRLSENKRELLSFVVKVNKLYEEVLDGKPPFMTFVLIGMQSSGKSTFMERILNSVVNIVQEGTGTRCPLDVTCILDESCDEPNGDLSGEELESPGTKLSVEAVFQRITDHNKVLANKDCFSTKALKLVYRAKNVQNMRFVDTPGIIVTKSSDGKDNREDIKGILRKEMAKPNTKLCVLLAPTEISNNYIIEFLDESLDGGREAWIENATFLMTKFDKQAEDSRSASKANSFFQDYTKEGIYPHLVMTPVSTTRYSSTVDTMCVILVISASHACRHSFRLSKWRIYPRKNCLKSGSIFLLSRIAMKKRPLRIGMESTSVFV
jgi:GTPase SAR1 family protein